MLLNVLTPSKTKGVGGGEEEGEGEEGWREIQFNSIEMISN